MDNTNPQDPNKPNPFGAPPASSPTPSDNQPVYNPTPATNPFPSASAPTDLDLGIPSTSPEPINSFNPPPQTPAASYTSPPITDPTILTPQTTAAPDTQASPFAMPTQPPVSDMNTASTPPPSPILLISLQNLLLQFHLWLFLPP